MLRKTLETIIKEQLSITLMSAIPSPKQEKLNIILSTMIGEMFEELNGKSRDLNTVLVNSADVLEFAGLLFINFSKRIKENEIESKEYIN